MITQRRFISTTREALSKEESLDYSRGYNAYLANDVVPSNQLVYATDTRISTVGRQKTRQGCDFYSVPAGETVNTQQISVTGAGNQNVGLTSWLAAKFTTSAAGRLTRVDLNLKNAAAATGPIIIEIRSDSSGSPSATVLAQSSIPAATPTGSYAYLVARFIEAPLLANATAYWIVAYVQSDGSGSYSWSSTTNAATAKTSANSGVSWSASAFDLNYKTYLSTDSPVLGHYRASKSDGTKVTLIAYQEAAGTTAVATVNDLTGALTAIKTGLSASATHYDFEQVQDVVYYCNGVDPNRKWDFTTEAVMAGSPPVAKRLKWHKNHMFLLIASDPARTDFSDTAAPETYTSTNFVYIPAPKSNDPITGWGVLNDNLYFITTLTKWGLYGSDLSNMQLRKVPGSKGSRAADSLCVDGNYIYFAADDNFYAFDGSTDHELLDADLNNYRAAINRDDMSAHVWNGRLYIFYTTPGGAQNSRCFVYNLGTKSLESNDTSAYVQKCRTWTNDSGQFLQGSSLVGALYYGEQSSNQYNNLGKALSWEIRTKYDHYGNPAADKHAKRWYPRFAASSGNYSVSCQYDKDFRNAPTTLAVPLQGAGPIWGSAAMVWGSFTWGPAALIAVKLTVPGRARYLQFRYKKEGVNTPCEFLGSTTYYSTRRAR